MAKVIIQRERNPRYVVDRSKYDGNFCYEPADYPKDSSGKVLHSGLGNITYEYVYCEALKYVYNLKPGEEKGNENYERSIGESRQVGGKSDLYTKGNKGIDCEEDF